MEYALTGDIIKHHSSRMQNLKKYYPFFKLQETSLHQFRDGKYDFIDMGYMTMAVLRFFIEENNFNDREITYPQYSAFIEELIRRDFSVSLTKEEGREIAGYIFDKIQNDGSPFIMEYYDPIEKQKKAVRTRLIDSRIQDGTVYYFITSDAIEFYLDTKEWKEESKITTQQLLLQKMITTRNFSAGIDVIRSINGEVGRLRLKKQEVLSILNNNIFEGTKVYEEFLHTVMNWFDEEQRLFQKNKELIDRALEKAGENNAAGTEKYNTTLEEIYLLETELKKAIASHGSLLQDCTKLQIKADELIRKAKLNKLRSAFHFQQFEKRAEEKDDASFLSYLVLPLLQINRRKNFSFENLDDIFCIRQEEEKGEEIKELPEQDYFYEDEAEQERISENFISIIKTLLDTIMSRHTFDLNEFNEVLEVKYFDVIFKNSDYYSFLIHICEKTEYDMDQISRKQDTFLEEILAVFLNREDGRKYKGLKFCISPSGEEESDSISHVITGAKELKFTTSNITFERMDKEHGQP